ncbi:immunoglobulin i-set domain-containing protein [Ditylenchus destructor]|uniref:Immunoglobulin i-set domain-containing protein n=1 Tax=Ditylenchus destructor TaxID=166010 RepID=A0AAD4N495_9BILA|nr:immunoglobulin i-set domain-containing protein [Ditylenchus destructor]
MMTEFYFKNRKFLILIFHLCVSQIFYATACPSKCKCYLDEQRVDCAGAGLSRLPDEIPSWVVSLDLRRNFLRSIDVPTLKKFSSLHTLFLMDNEIRHLDADILDELPRLRRLYLGRNQIRNLPALSLLRLSDIRVLDFHANHLRHVDANAFSKLNQLERVNLQKNFLQSLPHDLFSSNRLLRSVRLSHNPWNCDCRLWSTAEFLKSQPSLEMYHENDSINVLAKCQNPGHLRSLPLRDLTHDQAKCYSANIQNVDRALQLYCNVDNKQQFTNLLEPSKTTVQWLYGDSPLEENLNGEYEILSNGTLLLYNGKLEIKQFKCAINYVVSPARLTRHLQRFNPNTVRVTTRQHSPDAGRAPRFTYSLKERRYREGSAAKLNCEVIGTPRPQILWTFNDRPIETSRKYELHRDSTELVIYPFLEHDVGTYACEAVNVHGRIRSVARIGLIKSSPPVITEGPKSATVRVGQRALFKCKAKGEPRPDITWFFDGSEIPPELKGHYQVSDDGTELVIAQVSRQDQGTYSCMAGNPVGSMTGTAQLDVHTSALDALDRQLQSPNFLKNIVGQASENVNRAIQETRASFSKRVETNPQNLLRHFKFAAKKPVELSRAREIYEESLRLLAKHVDLGIQFEPSELPTNVSYESVLSVTHIQTIMELSGCMNGQFKDSCSNMCFHSKYRSYTGQCNNFEHPTWGVSQMPFYRLLPPIYENGFNTPGSRLPI